MYVPTARPEAHRLSAAILVAVACSLALAAACWMLVPLSRRVGWIAPIDDAYIHYQYAWQLARGRFFRFHPGDPVSTGETSPLYALLLAVLEIFRLSRPHLVAVSQLLGAPMLAATLLLAARAVRQTTGGIGSDFATAVVIAVHGFLLWIFFCGMETGLYLLALGAVLWGLSRWQEGQPPPRALVAAAALIPLARPDGILATAIVAALILLRRHGGWRPALVRAAIVVGPFAFYLLLTLIFTGRVTTAGLEMKAIPYLPYLERGARIDKILDNAGKALHDILLGGKDYFALSWELPLALIGWVGAVAQDVRSRRVGVGTVGFALLVFAFCAGSQVGVSQWRGERYQAPTFFLMTFGVALAIGLIAAQLPRLRVDIALPAGLVLALAPNLAKWQDIFITDASTIQKKQVAAATVVRDRLPRDARVFVCDAGALGFLSERWTYDAVGLTTFMRGNSYIAGPGSRFEELERWPRARWPNYAAVYYWCAWDGVQGKTLSQHLDLRVQEFADPGLGTGEQPALHHAGVVVDALDVADLGSEESHRWHEADGGMRERNVVVRGGYADHVGQIADGARQVEGAVEFVLRGQAGARASLVSRVQGGPATNALVNGKGWQIPVAQPGEWLEPELDLGSLKDRELRVRIELPLGARLTLGHVWLYQQSPPPTR